MKYGTKYLPKLLLAGASVCMLSACGQPERPLTVSDFCLNDRRISVEVEPGAGAEDAVAGNHFDTDPTVNEVLTHNEVFDRLCQGDTP